VFGLDCAGAFIIQVQNKNEKPKAVKWKDLDRKIDEINPLATIEGSRF